MVAQNMLCTYEVKEDFSEQIPADVTDCLQQIEIPDLLNMCAQCSEIPYNLSTMTEGDSSRPRQALC